MHRVTLARWKPKTLPQMFRKLKLAGAHPDVLWGVDAEKAQHNGAEMIRLETLMHAREQQLLHPQHVPRTASNSSEHFLFWMQATSINSGTSSSDALRAVQGTITPRSSHAIVKQQLSELFRQAGILEDFDLSSSEEVRMNLESVLRYADSQQTEHIHQSGSLYIRGDKAVENMRRFGVLLVIEEEGTSYLVTLPETATASPELVEHAPTYHTRQQGDSGRPYMPSKSIIGPNGEVDEEVQRFMEERRLRPFDLRMAGSHSSVERFVTAFERLERLYDVHRGRALRSGVCIVLSLRSPMCYVAPDGCIVLSVQRLTEWEAYLLSLPQPVWMDCVQKHKDWRLGLAPLLQERRRRLMRVADIFHFWRVTTESAVGAQLQWQDPLITRLLSEETLIRRTLQKYNLKSEYLKRRGELRFVEVLYSATALADGDVSSRKEIGFRISGDGVITINQNIMTTGQVLRVLKDNIQQAESFQKQHDDAIKSLEHLSRKIPVDFSVDSTWKLMEEGNLGHCLQTFVTTIKANEAQLGAFINALLHGSSAALLPANLPVKKRMVWVVSNRYETLPSGVVFVPYDVNFDSIKKLLLTHR